MYILLVIAIATQVHGLPPSATKKCIRNLISNTAVEEKTIGFINVDFPILKSQPQVVDVFPFPGCYYYVVKEPKRNIYDLLASSPNVFKTRFVFILPGEDDLQTFLARICGMDVVQAVLLVEDPLTVYGVQCAPKAALVRQNCTSARFLPFHPRPDGRNVKLLLHKSRYYPTLVDPYLKPAPGIVVALINLIGERTGIEVSTPVVNLSDETVINRRSPDVSLIYQLDRNYDKFHAFEVSSLIYQDDMVWIVPKAPQVESIKLLARLFTRAIWLGVGGVLLAVALLWWAFSKVNGEDSRSVATVILSLFAFMVNSPRNLLPASSSARMLMTAYLAFCMVLLQVLQTEMVSLIQNPAHEERITTIQQMLSSSLTPVVSHLAIKQLARGEHPSSRLLLAKATVIKSNLTESIRIVAYHRNASTHVGRQLLSTYTREAALVDVIQQNAGLQDIEVSLALRRGHPFSLVLNWYIARAQENGFLVKWLEDIGEMEYADVLERSNNALTVEHVKFALEVWGFGLALALLACVVEVATFKIMQTKRRVQ